MTTGSDKTDAAYYQALGLFVSKYAQAEAMLHVVARVVSGTSDEKGRAIFGGMRLGDVTSRVRALMNITEKALGFLGKPISAVRYADVAECIDQLNIISDARNALVHRTTEIIEGGLNASNEKTAKRLEAAEMTTFSLEDLANMKADCEQIFRRLSEFTFARQDSKQPWLYKPSPPPNPKTNSGGKGR